MRSKQKVIQVYVHLRRYLDSKQAMELLSGIVPGNGFSRKYLEQVIATKIANGKKDARKGLYSALY